MRQSDLYSSKYNKKVSSPIDNSLWFLNCNRLKSHKIKVIILPTFDTLIRRSGHYNAWKAQVSTWSLPVRTEMPLYSLWIKWVLKFLILWSDEINHSNFENAPKCLNKSWWYLLKHASFILKLKDLCNTCVYFQWKKTNSSRHIGMRSADMRGLHDKRQLLAKLRIASSENCYLRESQTDNFQHWMNIPRSLMIPGHAA